MIWKYELEDGNTGSIAAATDDDAWNIILGQLGLCPVLLVATQSSTEAVAA